MQPVFILLRGPTITQLENMIVQVNEKFPNAIYVGMNDYKILENKILSKIDKKFDWLYFSDPHIVEEYINQIKEFLARDEINHFIGDYDTIEDIEKIGQFRLMNKNGSVIYSSQSRGKIPEVSNEFYNSLTALLLTMIGLGFRKFVLFGADGGGDIKNLYYGHNSETREAKTMEQIHNSLKRDTANMNTHFWQYLSYIYDDKLRREMSNLLIFNCSPNSKITCLSNISYENLFNIESVFNDV